MHPPPDEVGDLSLDQLVELERRAEERAANAQPDDERDGADHADHDGVIVLPWWQHPMNIITLVVTAAILAAMTGWMVGDARSRPAHNDVDTGFLQDMRFHHEQAVFMAWVYQQRPDVNPNIEVIAASIVQNQNIEIGRMIQLLRNFGEEEARSLEDTAMVWMTMITDIEQMPGLANDDEIDALIASSGDEADRLFVELMSEHHRGGIEMAEFAAERAANDEVRKMATSMAKAQRGEIVEMEQLLD